VRFSRVLPYSLLACYIVVFQAISRIHQIPVAGYETDGVDFMPGARSISASRFPDWKAVRFGGDLHVLVWELP
jgi:hypothetical protein